MLKLLRKLDRKAESFVNELDRTLQDPISRATTLNAFRREDTHSAYPADGQLMAEVDLDADRTAEPKANTSSVPATPNAVSENSMRTTVRRGKEVTVEGGCLPI